MAARRVCALFIALGVAVLGALAGLLAPAALAAGPSAAQPLAGVQAALRHSPVYIDPAAGEPHVDPRQVLAVLPHGTYFAALPTSDIAATSNVAADRDPAALPPLLSAGLGRGGTFVVLVGGRLYGSSTTIPGQLGDELASAQAELPATGDGTGAVVALMRSLSGNGGLADAPGPSRAGGPVGAAVLIVLAIAGVAGALALWWWIRRPLRRRKRRRPQPLRDLVEIDYEGNVIRRTPAAERERGPGVS